MKTPHISLCVLPLLTALEFFATLSGWSNGTSSVTGSGGSRSLGTYQIAAWGDSLTQGNEDLSGITYPNQLAKLAGQTVYNFGIGGQTSSQIAVRMNAYAGKPEQTFASAFTVPASGTVDVTFQTGFEPVNTQYRSDYPNGVPISFSVAGQTYTGNVVETGTDYVFTPAAYPAAAVAVPADTAWTVVTPAGINSGCAVLWAGRNNVYADGAQVRADMAAMVAVVEQSTSCYLVMSVPNGEYRGEWKGAGGYNRIIALNNVLSAAYSPGNHYLDIRSALVALYNPNNPVDVLDHGNDVWPYSLRAGDISGSLTGLDSATTCAFTASRRLGAGQIISANAEMILISGGSNGAYTCTRGFAGTAPSTYASGTAFTGVDPLHLGQNVQSELNPKYTNGYSAVAALVYAWLQANGPK
jgi:hypothetical protein